MKTATTKAWEARWMFASDESKLEIDENVKKDLMGNHEAICNFTSSPSKHIDWC
jgi:hypothetical protein